jgi:hypothetical protein
MLGPPIYTTRAYRTSAAPNRERIAANAGGNSLGPIVADTDNCSLRAVKRDSFPLTLRTPDSGQTTPFWA